MTSRSTAPRLSRFERKRKDGTRYVYERETRYNPEKGYTETLRTSLLYKITATVLRQTAWEEKRDLRLPMLPGRGKSGSRSGARSETKPAGPYSTRPGTFLKPGLNRRTGEKPPGSPRFTAKWG